MDQSPNVVITQQSNKPSRFKPSASFVLLIIIVATLSLGGYFLFKGLVRNIPQILRNNEVTPQKSVPINQNQVEEIFKEATIADFIVNPNNTVSFVKLEKTRIHLPASIEIQPKEASGSFIFKAELIDKEGVILYYSWKTFPIIKPQKDGSFEAKVLTPYQAGAYLRLKNTQDKVILIRQL